MGKKRTRDSGAKPGKCNKCGRTDKSTILGTRHRKCASKKAKGIWEAP